MIRSMTAYAREEKKLETATLIWELRTVNHRYLEPFIRLPEDFRLIESDARDAIKAHLQRGKLEAIFTISTTDAGGRSLEVNAQNLKLLADLCETLQQSFPGLQQVSPLELLKWPGILEAPATDVKAISEASLNLLHKALEDLVVTREREGEKLRDAMLAHVAAMSSIVASLRERVRDILQKVRERLLARFEELQLQIDSDRVEQEMVMITQKSDVEEELKRLETHLHEVDRILTSKDKKPVGRRLDFLMQELNREANTLCSKSMDSDTTKAGIDLKVYIEQIREQVQNIE